ncbi:MAG: sulfatase-like hydrolase/transferase [Vicinamibacterales bacterium]
MTIVSDQPRRQWLRLAVALLILNVALTFKNVWPTPAITWTGGLSVELGVCLLAFAALAAWRGRVARSLVTGLAIFGVVLVLGRYAVVTSPALFGRDVNLYWDLRFVPDVAAMLARPASWMLTIAVVATVLVIPYLIYTLLRWALGIVAAASAPPGTRRIVFGVGIVLVGLFSLERSLEPDDEWIGYHDNRLFQTADFPPPVSLTYANQFRVLFKQLSGEAANLVGPGPSLDASLAAVRDTDVFVFFVESYGAIAYDRPEFNTALEASRKQFAADIASSGRSVVSAFVESPTFGGGSWLAHISLLTGIEVRDEDTNQVLLTQKRDSLVTTFSRRGFRTVAMMPGLQRDWPEGGFYGFDDIYGERRLDYKGPQFGWWVVPDQFSLLQLDTFEFDKTNRPPTFAFMAGVSTHTPFSPTAPYQPDWPVLYTKQPYPGPAIDEAYEYQPDWLNLGPSYVRAMQYVYASLGGYVKRRPDRDFVMIVLGDHQPPALVTGQGAPWDVPVHVIASRPEVLASFEASGFKPGVDPTRPVLGRMHTLTPMILKALSGD